MTECPKCGYKWKDAGRVKGGKAKVSKGFASPHVQAKAQATRQAKMKQREGRDK